MTLQEKIVNTVTGEITFREYTESEIAQVENAKAEAAKRDAASEETAKIKQNLLQKLGLTEDDIGILFQ